MAKHTASEQPNWGGISTERSALFLPFPRRLPLAPVRAPGCRELRHFHQPCGLAGVRTQSSLPDHNILWPCVYHALTPLSPCTHSVDRAKGRGMRTEMPPGQEPFTMEPGAINVSKCMVLLHTHTSGMPSNPFPLQPPLQ